MYIVLQSLKTVSLGNKAHEFHSGTPQVGQLAPDPEMLSLKSSPLSSMAAAFAFCPSSVSVSFSRSVRPEKRCKGRAKSRREIARSQNRPTIISHSSERGSQTHYKSSARNKNPRDTRNSGCNASCLILTAASWTRVTKVEEEERSVFMFSEQASH